MSTPRLYVENPVQQTLYNKFLKNEVMHGFWNDDIPDVNAEISEDVLGPFGWSTHVKVNFLNSEFFIANKRHILQLCADVEPGISIAEIRRQLKALTYIVNGHRRCTTCDIQRSIAVVNKDNYRVKRVHAVFSSGRPAQLLDLEDLQ